MQIHNAAVTGSFTYNGIDISDITGSEQSVVSLNEFSASILNYTSSNNQSVATLQGATASLQGATSSLFAYTASNSANVANLFATSASLNAAVADIRNATSSLYFATASIYGATSSLFNYSASSNLRIGSLEQYTASLNTRSASFACVDATNTFACAQYFSNTSNAISFSSTGSLYSDGGMRLTKDLYVSGTSYFNNVTVFGTQSINYITSSQLNIASNLITVNTSTPAVRFGGLAVYDSGSLGTGLTGSILWDSEANHWVYSNPSGSTYSGGMFISGPRSAALGSEQGTTACALMMGQGGDHITSSAVFHYGNATCFYSNSYISSSGATCFGGNTTIAGNLGVGTITPGQLIDVYKTSNDAVIRITSCTAGAYIVADSCTDGYYGLVLQSNSNQRWFIGGYTTSDLTFKTSQTGGNEWLRINRTSGVACFACQVCAPAFVGGTVSGTTGTFSGKLSVSQASTDFVAEFTNTANSTPYGLRVKDAGTPANNYPLLSVTNNAGSAEYFRVNSGTGLTTFTGVICSACQVCSPVGVFSGCVGIGTAPTQSGTKLQVAGVTDIWSSANTLLRLNHDGTRGTIETFTGGGYSVTAINPNGGNVGIGTTNPSQQLETTARFVIGNSVTGRVGTFGQNTATTDTYITILNTSGNFDMGTAPTGHYFYGQGVLPLLFHTNAIERMRITATGISCFACQVCALSYYSNVTSGRSFGNDNYAGNFGWISMYNTCGGIQLGMEGSTGSQLITGAYAYEGILVSKYCGLAISANNGGTLHVRIDNSGNMGIGIPPKNGDGRLQLSLGTAITFGNSNSAGADYSWISDGSYNFSSGNALVINTEKARPVVIGTCGTSRFCVGANGISTFSCQICLREAVYVCGSFPRLVLDRSVTSAQSDIKFVDAGTSVWSIGTAVQAVGSNLDFYNYTLGGNVLKLTTTGESCFKYTVCSPNFVSSGKIHSPYYSQRFDGDGNGNYYSSTVFQANSTAGAGANWVTLARIDSFNSSNTRVIAKVTALMISATADQGNEHVGYGLINSALTSYACPMTVSTGAILGNANVGTIKWCGTCLLYCAPAGSYFTSMIKTELAAKDSATITLFCGSTNY